MKFILVLIFLYFYVFLDNVTKRIENVNEYFTFSLYSNVCRSLFEKHKLLFSFLVCVRILQDENKIDIVSEYSGKLMCWLKQPVQDSSTKSIAQFLSILISRICSVLYEQHNKLYLFFKIKVTKRHEVLKIPKIAYPVSNDRNELNNSRNNLKIDYEIFPKSCSHVLRLLSTGKILYWRFKTKPSPSVLNKIDLLLGRTNTWELKPPYYSDTLYNSLNFNFHNCLGWMALPPCRRNYSPGTGSQSCWGMDFREGLERNINITCTTYFYEIC